MIDIKRILVPIDFSDHSKKALDTGIALAKALDAEVHVLHVIHYPVQIAVPGQIAIPQDLWTEIRDAAARKLEKAAQTAKTEGVGVETHLSEGPSAHSIVDCAKKIKADLVIMGTRGLSGLKHVVLGSVAERTVRLAPCPVMTVHADEG